MGETGSGHRDTPWGHTLGGAILQEREFRLHQLLLCNLGQFLLTGIAASFINGESPTLSHQCLSGVRDIVRCRETLPLYSFFCLCSLGRPFSPFCLFIIHLSAWSTCGLRRPWQQNVPRLGPLLLKARHFVCVLWITVSLAATRQILTFPPSPQKASGSGTTHSTKAFCVLPNAWTL